MTNDDTDHQRQLLTNHLRYLLVQEEELTKNPKDISLRMQRDGTRSELNQCAEQLGLGTLPAALRAITEAAGLRAETIGSFRRQREHVVAYQQKIELQKLNALPADKATFTVLLQQAAECLTTIDQQLAELGVSCHQQQADQFLARCATISWPATALRNAFRRIFPYHRLPESGEDALLRSILTELADNTCDNGDPIRRFAQGLLAEPDLGDAQRDVLREWLGPRVPEHITHPDPGLLIAIELVSGTSDQFQLRAWFWPERRLLWPPVGETHQAFQRSELPRAIQALYANIHHHIAPVAVKLWVEFLLHRSLLTEPTHEWDIISVFDDDDPDDCQAAALYLKYPVVVRSSERALSAKPAMVEARSRWRERWKLLPTGCQRSWQQPQSAGAAQQPPFFCSTAAEEFERDLYTLLINDDYLCFVETVAPSTDTDFIKKVLHRVVCAGIPIGLWFAYNAVRDASLYHCLEGLLDPQHLRAFHHAFRHHWKSRQGIRPVLFFDDPTRLPYEPDIGAFESPSAV